MRPRVPALAWAVVVAGLAAFLAWRLPGLPVETSVLALLPEDGRHPQAEEALKRLAAPAQRRLVCLVGHADPAQAALAADRFAGALKGSPQLSSLVDRAPEGLAERLRGFYAPHRARLLDRGSRALLTRDPAEAGHLALDRLYGPSGAPALLPLDQDPLGLFTRWALEAGASASPLQPRDGRLAVEDGGLLFYAVLAETPGAGLDIAGQLSLLEQVERAAEQARSAEGVRVLRSGFALHAAEAARQASAEMSTIGTGSALGVLAVVGWAFRSLLPLALVLLPVAVGCLAGAAAVLLAFPKVHVITLVFGSSIIGIAEDYGTHFLSGVFAPGKWEPRGWLVTIRRGLGLALLTSLLGYAAMLILPFPGVRQMGLYSLAGLGAAWATTVWWMPLLSRRLKKGPPAVGRLAQRLAKAWPRWDSSAKVRASVLVGAALAVLAATRLSVVDDVRQLYAAEPSLAAEQKEVERLLKLPASGQFILVRQPDQEALLQAEEALLDGLEALRDRGELGGVQALSQWVPSLRRQEADLALQRSAAQAGGPIQALETALEEPGLRQKARAALAASDQPLRLDAWLAAPLSTPWRSLWLGPGGGGVSSALALQGLTAAGAAEAAALAKSQGSVLVDRVASISAVVGRFRRILSGVLLGGLALVMALLAYAYGRAAWRPLAPVLLGGLAGLAALAGLGQPFNLFAVLALVLLLGMGVDFGIYVAESAKGHEPPALMAIMLSASTTVLAFGLLGLSSTPALRVFGVTLSAGLLTVWLTAPCFGSIRKEKR